MMLCGNHPLRTTSEYHKTTNARSNNALNTSHDSASSQSTTQSRLAAARKKAARSKSKLWGPSHSFDSDDEESQDGNGGYANDAKCLGVQGGFAAALQGGGSDASQTPSWWETLQGAWTELGTVVRQGDFSPQVQWSAGNSPQKVRRSGRSQLTSSLQHTMEPVKEEEEDSTDPSTTQESSDDLKHLHTVKVNKVNVNDVSKDTATTMNTTNNSIPPPDLGLDNTHNTTNTSGINVSMDSAAEKVEEWTDLFRNACTSTSPCSAQELEEMFANSKKANKKNKQAGMCGLGISPLQFDYGDNESITCTEEEEQPQPQSREGPPRPTTTTNATSPPVLQPAFSEDSAFDRRRQRHQKRKQRHEDAAKAMGNPITKTNSSTCMLSASHEVVAPHEDFEVTSQQDVLIFQPTTTTALQQRSQGLPAPTTVAIGSGLIEPEPHNDSMTLHFPPGPSTMPIDELLVKQEDAQALARSISELTMRSSYQPDLSISGAAKTAHPSAVANHNNNTATNAVTPVADQRRMAYYAVGRNHRTSGSRSGGNRRCYFTGKLIFGGAPFYAGTVQQGLRTLVVFCLPSALGMPQNLPSFNPKEAASASKHWRNGTTSHNSRDGSVRTGILQRSRRTLQSAVMSSSSRSSIGMLSRTHSKLSSTINSTINTNLDDMSLSIEGDLDPNWNLDKDYLLSILPEPNSNLLAEMNQRYPEQFETLPVQVRKPSCWRLFVKFCFFSGLPIAEGELHYQVLPKLAMEAYGEDIVLSHDVMEAVNGVSSAEILKLPNQKTFRYLKKHYQQQSSKLPEIAFHRTSWEQVHPEI